ncbi:MAG: substrate-binding domain-containing protein [Caldilinea sp.]
MNKQRRIRQLLARITEDRDGAMLSTHALAAEFGVSEITMRRDLQELADAGLIQRRHGGVLGASRRATGAKSIGIVVISFQGKFSHPFYNELLEGADSELHCLGYAPAFVKTFAEVSTRAQIQALSQLHPISGLLILGELDDEKCRLWNGVTSHIVSAPSIISPQITAITYDGYLAMRQLLDHLVKLGRRRIGLIVGQSDAGRMDDRMRGYLAGIAEHDLERDESLCFSVVHTLERLPSKIGREGAEHLMRLAQPPDAIMCSSDTIALGAMQWLQAAGCKIPDDVAVTGFDNLPDAQVVYPSISRRWARWKLWFDNLPDAQVVYPPLTTVHLHKHLLGRLAAEQVHRRIEHPDDPPLTVVTPTSLVIRRSCGA